MARGLPGTLVAVLLGISMACATPYDRLYGGPCPDDRPEPPIILQQALEAGADPQTDGIEIQQLSGLCEREADHPACAGVRAKHQQEVSFAELTRLDAGLRRVYRYREDGVDQWHGRTTCGACADYALTLASLLADRGQPGKRMYFQLMFLRYEGAYYAHATLWVVTTDRGMVEAGVNDPPRRLDWAEGARLCYLPMDGSRRFQALPGYVVNNAAEVCQPR